MSGRTTRRRLLSMGAAGALALGAPRAHSGPAPIAPPLPKPPLFKISLAQWSLHRGIRAGELNPLDFARVAKQTWGIEAVEYVNQFFAQRATDFDYLAQMKARADEHGVRSLLIMIDGEGLLADADQAKRRRAIENHFKWIAAAKFLGCHAIRVNAGGSGGWDEQKERAADSLRRLAEFAEPYDVDVLVENHGGLSSNGEWLAAVMDAADHARVGTLPDFGNFRLRGDTWYDRYEGVRQLMPWAKAVSAKSHDFDEGGNETGTDYARMLKIVRDAGYRGYVGIEFEGSRLSEHEGIAATKLLLERVRGAL